jgi:hypothetical protein
MDSPTASPTAEPTDADHKRFTPVMSIITLAVVVAAIGNIVQFGSWKMYDFKTSGYDSSAFKWMSWIRDVTASSSSAAFLLLYAAAIYLAHVLGEPTAKKGLRLFGYGGLLLVLIEHLAKVYMIGWLPKEDVQDTIILAFVALGLSTNTGICIAAWRRTPIASVCLTALYGVFLINRIERNIISDAVGDDGYFAMRMAQFPLYWLLFRSLAQNVTCWPQPMIKHGYQTIAQSLTVRLWIAGFGVFLTLVVVTAKSAGAYKWLLPVSLIGGWLTQWWTVAGALRLTFAGTGVGIRTAFGAGLLTWAIEAQSNLISLVIAGLVKEDRGSSMLREASNNLQYAIPIATVVGFLLLANVVSHVAVQRGHRQVQQTVVSTCVLYVGATFLISIAPFLLMGVRSAGAAIFVLLLMAAAGLVAVLALRRLFQTAYLAVDASDIDVAPLPTATAIVRE